MSKNTIYINGLGSVSIQEQARNFDFSTMLEIQQGINIAKQPSYKDLMPPASLRRMSKGVKMGMYAAKMALQESDIETPDAIITGTGLGCLIDSEKFLELLLENDENHLTPTAFIQSTHNTVGGQIALQMGCKGYNFTYVHQNSSFESALLDAFLQIKGAELENALVGGIDEVGSSTYKHLQIAEKINTEEQLFESGVNAAEGATFFFLNKEATEESYAEILDISIENTMDKKRIEAFLSDNKIAIHEVGSLFLGSCELAIDKEYFSSFESLFPMAEKVLYKRYVGHHHTASAFGLLLAAEQVKKQVSNEKYTLLYNQFEGKDHSLILLKKC